MKFYVFDLAQVKFYIFVWDRIFPLDDLDPPRPPGLGGKTVEGPHTSTGFAGLRRKPTYSSYGTGDTRTTFGNNEADPSPKNLCPPGSEIGAIPPVSYARRSVRPPVGSLGLGSSATPPSNQTRAASEPS